MGLRKFAITLGVLTVLGMAGVGGAYFYFDYAAKTPFRGTSDTAAAGEVRVFEVPKGVTLREVGRLLENQSFIQSELVFRVYLKLHRNVPAPKAGKHELSSAMNIPQILVALSQNPLIEDVPLTMVEGWRLRDADEFLTAQGLVEKGAYLAAAQSPSNFKIPFPFSGSNLEGYLFPETYRVPPGKVDVEALIQRQIEMFDQRFVRPHADEIEKSGRTLRDLVILASLLEREEPTPELRPDVAGVLYNRLDARIPTPLGVDATSRYTIDNWNDRRAFLRKLRDPSDPFNTRLRPGLPPTPIGAPSLPSLLAALRPNKSPYWYYLHDSNRQIHFAKTAAEHEANRRKYNVW